MGRFDISALGCGKKSFDIGISFPGLRQGRADVLILKEIGHRHKNAVCTANLAIHIGSFLLVLVFVSEGTNFIDERLSADHAPSSP